MLHGRGFMGIWPKRNRFQQLSVELGRITSEDKRKWLNFLSPHFLLRFPPLDTKNGSSGKIVTWPISSSKLVMSTWPSLWSHSMSLFGEEKQNPGRSSKPKETKRIGSPHPKWPNWGNSIWSVTSFVKVSFSLKPSSTQFFYRNSKNSMWPLLNRTRWPRGRFGQMGFSSRFLIMSSLN